MSSEKGNLAKKGPKHQNRFAYRHNPKSPKTQYILSLPNQGLCPHCHEIIEWKKKYRKYKPLSTPSKCQICEQRTVKRAYHTICDECARKQNCCAKCRKANVPIVAPLQTEEEKVREQNTLKEGLEMMSERERRSFFRNLEKNDGKEPQDQPLSKRKTDDDDDDDDDDLLGEDLDEELDDDLENDE